jgi:hypothetical protein
MAAVAAATTKTSAAIAMAGVTDNNQPKAAEEEMSGEMATGMVTMTMTARARMAAMATAAMAGFLPDRQQSAKRGSRRNGGGDGYGDSNGNGNGNSGSDGKDNDNGKDNNDGKDKEYTTIN